ncbi:MAG TPA: methylmalonyl Co-A mutase-associated GTPase MeaB [Stellaceae bacterium]|jgi:LAO/AO transport system kinase|nr:methylmalonyl Co-A mutase-associated GTPase MeaB [Stellaceae bacterium]
MDAVHQLAVNQLAVNQLAGDLQGGDRRALARAVTLVESTRPDHRRAAEQLIELLLPATGRASRIGISGPPGAGKSTFIERFGLDGIARGHRIAVLAVDPGSKRGGGAILGDKTRMAELGRAPEAFIRPSSAGSETGGVARRTRESILVCEAAGFDTVLVETVGAGQAETTVAEMVDMFLLVLPPAAGDELQGIKRGIIELADLILINKADGNLLDHARRAAAEYANAVHLLRPALAEWQVAVRAVSALTGDGIDAVWDDITKFRAALEITGNWQSRRAEQARAALFAEIGDGLLDRFRAAPAVAARFAAVEQEVRAGGRTPAAAARLLLAAFLDEDQAGAG